MYSAAPPEWLSRLKWIQAALWFSGVASILSLKFLFLYFTSIKSEVQQVIVEASALIFGNMVSVMLRILVGLWFIVWQIRIAEPQGVASIRTVRNRSGFYRRTSVIVECLKAGVSQIKTPVVGFLVGGVVMRFSMQRVLHGGIETLLSRDLSAAGNFSRAIEIVESYKFAHPMNRILFQEVGAAVASLLTVIVLSVPAFLQMKRSKRF